MQCYAASSDICVIKSHTGNKWHAVPCVPFWHQVAYAVKLWNTPHTVSCSTLHIAVYRGIQGHTTTQMGTHEHTGTHKGAQEHTRTHRSTQSTNEHTGVKKGTNGYTTTHRAQRQRSIQKDTGLRSKMHCQTVALRGVLLHSVIHRYTVACSELQRHTTVHNTQCKQQHIHSGMHTLPRNCCYKQWNTVGWCAIKWHTVPQNEIK